MVTPTHDVQARGSAREPQRDEMHLQADSGPIVGSAPRIRGAQPGELSVKRIEKDLLSGVPPLAMVRPAH